MYFLLLSSNHACSLQLGYCHCGICFNSILVPIYNFPKKHTAALTSILLCTFHNLNFYLKCLPIFEKSHFSIDVNGAVAQFFFENFAFF